MLSFAQFGSDLDESTKKILNHGRVVTELLKQEQYSPLSLDKEVVQIYAGMNGYLDAVEPDKVSVFLENLYTYISRFYEEILVEINAKHELNSEIEQKLKEAIESFIKERA